MNRDRAVNLAIAIMQGNTSDHGSVARQIAMLGLLALVAALTTATAYALQVEVPYIAVPGCRLLRRFVINYSQWRSFPYTNVSHWWDNKH